RALQEDQFLRFTTEWGRRINDNIQLNISAASFIDEQLYTDPEVNLRSEINTSSNFLRASTVHTFGSFILKPTINLQYKTAETANYNGSVRDWFIVSPGVAFIKPVKDYKMRLHLRYDQHSAFESTPVADLSIGKSVGALQWSLNGSRSRSQRMPTFNELFWQVDEPRDIKRELGWKVSQMTQWSKRKGNWKWMAGMDLFWIQMQDMIQWISSENGFVPRNLNVIENISGDLKLEVQHQGKSLKGLKLNGNALRYIQAPTWVDEEDHFRMYYRLNGTAFISYKGWTLIGHLQSQQNLPIFSPNTRVQNEWVTLFHGGIEKTIEFNKHQLQLKWFVRNITDESVSILNAYAMPGRVMEMTINYTLKSKQTNEK
ncbi:MAG: TonB-dependent receptor, partial [Bacteroidota bacterium]